MDVSCAATAQAASGFTNCLFEEPWWLDAVAPNAWDAVTVVRGGQVVARLAYVLRRRYGLCLLGHPPLTQTLGPWLALSGVKYATRLAEEKALASELIQCLPKCDLFAQNFSPAITNPLPFYWNGYQHKVHFTYRIEDLSDPERVWGEFTKDCRNTIRKAQKQLVVREDLGTDAFYDLIIKTWSRQCLRPPFRREILYRVNEACRSSRAGRIFHAEDAQSNIHAAIYLVWDSRAAYYLMGAADPELRNSGAQNLLLWEAIRFASSVTRVFDFEGSMNEHIEHFFRSFGARQTPLLHVRKMSRRLKAMTALKDLIEACSGKRLRWFF